MARIESYVQVETANVGYAFPRPFNPSYVYTDFPYETNPTNWGDNQGFITLPAAELVMAAPYRVPHNQKYYPPTDRLDVKLYPSVNWQQTDSSGGTFRYATNYPYLFTEIGFENWNEAPNTSIGATCFLTTKGNPNGSQGFTFMWQSGRASCRERV